MPSKSKRPQAKYERLATLLEKELDEQRWEAGEQLPAERQLADAYGMSHMTVNKAVASLVAKGLLQRRGRATYVAQPEVTPMSRAVGAVIEVRMELDPLFLQPLLGQLPRAGRMPLVIDMSEEKLVEQQFVELSMEGVEVFIVDAYSKFPFQVLDKVRPCPRLIFLHRYESPRDFPGHRFIMDYQSVGRLAARTALEQGRRFPAIAGFHREPLWTSQRFYEGATDYMKEAGVQLQAEWLTNDMREKDFIAALREHPQVDCILTVNDFRLVPFLRAAAKLGRSVPDDLFLIGAGNSPHATTLGLPSVGLEQDRLVDLALANLDSTESERITIEAETVHWNTTI